MLRSRDSSVGIATDYGLDGQGIGVRFPAGVRAFLFSTASRPSLRLIQPPNQWVPGALSPWVKCPESEADHSFPSSAEIKNDGVYLHSPLRLHSVVFNQLSTGTFFFVTSRAPYGWKSPEYAVRILPDV
jgi:hypothetical protein